MVFGIMVVSIIANLSAIVLRLGSTDKAHRDLADLLGVIGRLLLFVGMLVYIWTMP